MVIFMKKQTITKIVTLCLIIVTLSPIVTLTVQSQMNGHFDDLTTKGEDTKLYKGLLYKTGILGNIMSLELYHFQMKANKTYVLRAKFDITEGAFSLDVSGPGGVHIFPETWSSSEPKSARVIQFLFTPTDTGDHTIFVWCIIGNAAGEYSLYVNQDGFAGWWWMLAVGIGAVLLIVIVFVGISRAVKPKRKGKKRR